MHDLPFKTHVISIKNLLANNAGAMEQQPDTKIFPLCKVHFGELLGHQQSF
jgi:hypothetical protein